MNVINTNPPKLRSVIKRAENEKFSFISSVGGMPVVFLCKKKLYLLEGGK